ncbi:uncharacterized protein [Panulirus ornatus]|uniref:uncharacterized protein isoform X2 n=1 Tax=Panulirus ornatus TaxID=150431 RepID=UPI003A86E9F5
MFARWRKVAPKKRLHASLPASTSQDDHVGLGKPRGRQTPQVQNYTSETAFGWGFPEVEAKKRVVIDAKWLKEYSDDIGKVQAEVKRLRDLSFGSHGQNDSAAEDLVAKKERQASLSCSTLKQNENVIEQSKRNAKDERTLSANIQEHIDYVKNATCGEISLNDSGFEELSVPEMQRLPPHGGDMEVKAFVEALNAPESELETRSVTPQSEACYSMLSFASRDSGVYASDDVTEFLPEASGERSFFDELGDVFGSHETPPETCAAAAKREPVGAAASSGAEAGNKYPVWFQRFSEDDDLTVHLRSLNWDSGLCLGKTSTQSVGGEVETEETPGCPEDTEDCESGVEEVSETVQRRQRLRNLWSVCDRLEALSLHGRLASGGVTEVMQLVESFSRIDDRLQVLRYGLNSLTLQAHENRNDLRSLEDRASHLLTTTATSRRHMAHLYALQKLEDRLQEEWWAAYNPNTVVLHENYIV